MRKERGGPQYAGNKVNPIVEYMGELGERIKDTCAEADLQSIHSGDEYDAL